MKIDFSQELKALDGTPFKKDKDSLANLGDMCITALLTENPKEVSKPEDKLKRWELAKMLYGKVELDLKAEDVVLLKKKVGEIFTPALMGTIYDLLEAKE